MKDLQKFLKKRMSKYNNGRFTTKEQLLILEDLKEDIEKYVIEYADSFIRDELSRYDDLKVGSEWIWEK